MNTRLALLQLYTPPFVKEKKLRELFDVAARAFRTTQPDIQKLSGNDLVHAFATFTQREAERVIEEHGNVGAVERALYEGAHALGKDLRNELSISSHREAFRAASIVYRALGIDLHIDSRGGLLVRHCFFSRFYTPEVCRLISSLDRGLIAGLSAEGRLSFTARITEGGPCCLGRIEFGVHA